jgi:hypothetical protein
MSNIGALALGALVMLVCRAGFHMAFWPSLVIVVLAAVVYTAIVEAKS